jgi:hypothetical protein
MKVALNWGHQFAGADRWLEIGLRTYGVGHSLRRVRASNPPPCHVQVGISPRLENLNNLSTSSRARSELKRSMSEHPNSNGKRTIPALSPQSQPYQPAGQDLELESWGFSLAELFRAIRPFRQVDSKQSEQAPL